VLWHNRTGLIQVFYDSQIEPAYVKPGFAINDLDLPGVASGLTPVGSIYEIVAEKPDARICLARASSIGDIILMTPTLYRIRELFPLCRIFFATVDHYLPLFKHLEFVELIRNKLMEVYDFDVGYDFDLSLERAEGAGWGRQYHRSDIYARLLGLDLKEHRYDLPYPEAERQRATELLCSKGYRSGPLVGFQLRGASVQRSLPIEKVRTVVSRLAERGLQVVLLDSDGNAGWEAKNVLNLCGMLDTLGLFAVVDCCDLVVSTDSGITHVAGVLGKRNVAFFACVPAENRVKYPNCKVVDLARAHGCEPCWEGGGKCGQRWSCLAEADENLLCTEIIGELKL